MQNDENPIAKETISDNQTTSQQPTAQKQLPDQQLTTNKSNKRKRQPSHDVNYARLLPQCVSRLAELFITDLTAYIDIKFETSTSPFNIQNRFKSPLTWACFQTLSLPNKL
ncbi:hypothetical protein PS6_008187 [Mucor atramentarius]